MIELLLIDTDNEQPVASLFSCEREIRPLLQQLLRHLSPEDAELCETILNEESTSGQH